MKPKLFLFGACDLDDIMNNDLLYRDFEVVNQKHTRDNTIVPGSINFDEQRFPGHGTSLISLYTEPNNIAMRVADTLVKCDKRERIESLFVYQEVVKFPYLEFFKKHAGPEDYLVISFSSELYTKVACANEVFTCLPAMQRIFRPEHPLYWLYKEYMSNDNYHLPFDTKESLELSFDIMEDFTRDIYEIFKDRVILVKTHFSNLAISDGCKVVQMNVGPDDLLFYKQTKIAHDPTDHKYAERLSRIIMNKFRHHYSADVPLIELKDNVFLDASHKWGLSQFHIDAFSRNKIARKIHEHVMSRRTVIEQ
jgi:hypothetical protein